MKDMKRLILNLENYLGVCRELLETIEAKYNYSLLRWFDEEDIFWYELKITEISERIRAALDSALFSILSNENTLTDQQKWGISFKEEYERSFKRVINHDRWKKFHNFILYKDKWGVIPAIISDTNHSKHRFFQIQVKSTIGRVLVVHSKNDLIIAIPYTVNTSSNGSVWCMNFPQKTKAYINWDNTSIEVWGAVIEWWIDLNNGIIPEVSWSWIESFIQNNALIRMEIEGNISRVPGNTFYIDYYKYLIDILSNILMYLQENHIEDNLTKTQKNN